MDSFPLVPLPPAGLIEVVLGFVSAFGALLIWNLPRYRALAHYLIYQAVLMSLNLYEANSTGFLVTPVFILLKGPLLYLFIRAMVNEKPLRGLSLCMHFLPFLAPLLIPMPGAAVLVLGSLSQVAYLGLSFQLLHRYHSAAREFRSDAESLKLTWLVVAYWLIAAQAVIGLVRLNLQPVLGSDMPVNWFSFDLLFLLGVCCFLLYKAVRQPLLYDQMLAYEGAASRPTPKDSEVDTAQARSVFAHLEAMIVKEQLYRKPRLSVDDLAAATGMQMKDISWAFNSGADRSFNDYINGLRINAFKQRLLESGAGQMSVLEMALESGFNSKSSFNATFKREVGMTPSQYISQTESRGWQAPQVQDQ